MIIKIEKDKAKRIALWNSLVFGIPITLIFMLTFNFMVYMDNYNKSWGIFPTIYSLMIGILGMAGYFCYRNVVIDSLEYEFDEKESRLIKVWKFIVKTKDTAKLQVVNSIDMNQGLIEKLFGLFNVHICYGFGADGYHYTFKYLSEETAENLLKLIKPSGGKVDLK